MVQGKLAGLIGKSSGYIDSLSPIVKQRVDGLKGLQLEHTKLEAEFQREILELEKRFAEKYRPIYERRRAIIEGKEEPTEEEIKTGYQVDLDDEDSEDEDEEAAPREREIVPAEEAAKGPKGIPGFWLTALSNHAGISELITERDEEALKHLIDVRVEYLGEGKRVHSTNQQGLNAQSWRWVVQKPTSEGDPSVVSVSDPASLHEI